MPGVARAAGPLTSCHPGSTGGDHDRQYVHIGAKRLGTAQTEVVGDPECLAGASVLDEKPAHGNVSLQATRLLSVGQHYRRPT